jgi:hypothetical protein
MVVESVSHAIEREFVKLAPRQLTRIRMSNDPIAVKREAVVQETAVSAAIVEEYR